MNDDPLLHLRRPPSQADSPAGSARHPVAPAWIGPCLRVAGEASAPMLTFRQRDGKLTSLAYCYLTSVVFDPAASLDITFANHVVSVHGRRLLKLYEELAAQRALEVAESTSKFDEGGDGPFIDTLAIVPTQPR